MAKLNECCGFCKHYICEGPGVTKYRGHRVQVGYCPKKGETLETMEAKVWAMDLSIDGNWDEAYRWASHTACTEFDLDEISYNDPSKQYLKEL